MSFPCQNCGCLLRKKGKRGPNPLRCAKCTLLKRRQQRQQQREANPRTFVCVDCGTPSLCHAFGGPAPSRCGNCRADSRHAINRRQRRYRRTCINCCTDFMAYTKKGMYCSRRCYSLGLIRAAIVQCAGPSCHNLVALTPSQLRQGAKCCSRKCLAALRVSMRPVCVCQNALCGKVITRSPQGAKRAALGSDSRKYCSRECAWDARWGEGRPRKGWSEQARASAARSALQTNIRKKCKLLGVPFDEQCTRHAVLERDAWKCQLCGIRCNREYKIDTKTRQIDWRNAEHDHIVPLTLPGSPGNVFPNSQCLCRKCNNRKRGAAAGQLRLDLEGSVQRWESVDQSRRRRNSRSCGAIPAAVV